MEEHGEDVETDLALLAGQSPGCMSRTRCWVWARVRLGLVLPGCSALQVRAIAEAACFRQRMGGDPRAEIMIPLVGSIQELELVIDEAQGLGTLRRIPWLFAISVPDGTMIELPRAALTAGQIAEAAEFFSFGTNDLTQTTWGFSRDDVEAAFFLDLYRQGVFGCRRSSRSTGRRRLTHPDRGAVGSGNPSGPPLRSLQVSMVGSAVGTSSMRSGWTTSVVLTLPRPGGPV